MVIPPPPTSADWGVPGCELSTGKTWEGKGLFTRKIWSLSNRYKLIRISVIRNIGRGIPLTGITDEARWAAFLAKRFHAAMMRVLGHQIRIPIFGLVKLVALWLHIWVISHLRIITNVTVIPGPRYRSIWCRRISQADDKEQEIIHAEHCLLQLSILKWLEVTFQNLIHLFALQDRQKRETEQGEKVVNKG